MKALLGQSKYCGGVFGGGNRGTSGNTHNAGWIWAEDCTGVKARGDLVKNISDDFVLGQLRNIQRRRREGIDKKIGETHILSY